MEYAGVWSTVYRGLNYRCARVCSSLEYERVHRIQESGVCRRVSMEYGGVWSMEESGVWRSLEYGGVWSMESNRIQESGICRSLILEYGVSGECSSLKYRVAYRIQDS
jgi:hypothetical protein